MSDRDLEAKFRAFARGILSSGETERLLALCWKADALENAADIARAAVPAGSR
jgi:hypothetical protein